MGSTRSFLTTGEAAQVLGVSPSTVMRRFDRGDLAGKQNPVTRKRVISKGSLAQFMAAHKLPADRLAAVKKRVLVVGADGDDLAALKASLPDETEVELDSVQEGCEVCGRALEWQPDLVVIDVQLPDMPGRDVIRCMRRLPPLGQARIALSSPPDVRLAKAELAAMDVNEYFPKPWKPAALSGKLIKLLGIRPSGPVESGVFRHRRKWPRLQVDWPATLKFFTRGQTKAFSTGTASVRDISRGGAFLFPITVDGGSFPADAFSIDMHIPEGSSAGLSARGRPVRIETNGGLGMGIEFMRLGAEQAKRISKAVGV